MRIVNHGITRMYPPLPTSDWFLNSDHKNHLLRLGKFAGNAAAFGPVDNQVYMSVELNEPSSFGSALKTIEGETQEKVEIPSSIIEETVGRETPTGEMKAESSDVPETKLPKFDVKIPTLNLSGLTPDEDNIQDQADKSSLSDNEATKEFDAAFGFADKQPQDQNKTDDKVDIKLKGEFKEFMEK